MKLLWLSRHVPTDKQVDVLKEKFGADLEIVEVSKSVANAAEVVALRDSVGAEEMVVVLPPAILADLTNPRTNLGQKPIRAVMNRIENGDTFEFVFDRFERVEKVEVISSPL